VADDGKVKNRVIFTLIVVVLIMITGIIVLAQNNLFVIDPGNNDKWSVKFSSISDGIITGSATNRKKPSYSGTKVSFYVDFVLPGDSVVYDVQISNYGNIDAQLQEITYVTSSNKEEIKYEIIDLKEGDVLKAGTSANFKIKVSYEIDASEAVTFNKPMTINFNYGQYIK